MIIALKGHDGLSNDPWLRVASTDGGCILLDHQKDGRQALNKANICLH